MFGYLCMTLVASFILRWIEKKLDGADNYELVNDDQLVMAAGTYNYPDKGTPFDERHKPSRDTVIQEVKLGRNRGER